MKKILFLCILGCLPLAPSHAELPEGGKELIVTTSEKATEHFAKALDLAQTISPNENNFESIAKSLGSFGYGETPSTPPYYRPGGGADQEDDGTSEQVREDRKKEVAERIKMLGRGDLDFLVALDSDKDLKVDNAEINASLQNQLKAELDNKLKVDGDGDNQLSLLEYALIIPAKGEKDEDGVDWHQRGHFEQDDTDGDGFLNITEMLSPDADWMLKRVILIHFVHTLPQIDSDNDQKISRDELAPLTDEIDTIWKKASTDGSPVALDQAFPAFYWLSAEELTTILSAQ